ncbi:polysaccharide biosynthesis tyrosine autokinase [Stieleria sp. JC731]|uniref:polysaccharide biosynthesis tyrosine autokinase n=1 Tax=Pirellulaceae TaxID=2691357 RepID=UPI001E4375E0|nr:polysaccharide biosynthesis tyrosine autokinase [Stieleria sp. JC731]MCC9599953.1 polysaccharide biosynthesis tyrosine autokinase [Stieleria sp. JC731]
MTNAPASESNERELDFNLDLAGMLRRRIHLIAFGLLVGSTAATIYYQKQQPLYQSSLTVLVSQKSSEIARKGVRSSDDSTIPVQDKILATHMQLFTSPKILQKAIDDFGLDKNVGQISRGLAINKAGEASILNATYEDSDPEVAAKVLDAVFKAYHSYVETQSKSVGQQAVELIATTQAQNENELRLADEEYRQFVASVPALVGSGGLSDDVHRSRLRSIETELSKVRQALADANSRRQVIVNATKGKDPEEVTDAQVMSLLSQEDISRLNALVQIKERRKVQHIADSQEEIDNAMERQSWQVEFQRLMGLSSQRHVLRTTYGAGHPSVRALEAEIQSIRDYVDQYRTADSEDEESVADANSAEAFDLPPAEILKTYFEILKSDINQFTNREQELLAQSERETELAKEVELTVLKGDSLRANLDRAQARYDEVFKRLQELTLSNEYSGFATDLLVTPKAANFPFWPSKSKIAISGVMSGVMLGLVLAMIAEIRDRTFRNPTEVEAAVGAKILAHAPQLSSRKLQKAAIPDSKISPMVATFHQPCGNEAESYRALRTSILLLAKRENKNVFLLSSPSPGDGKTTTICNLAVSIAQTGKRVLLIDADMRRPMIDYVFGIENSLGLSDLMRGHRALSMCLNECEQLNLTLCPSGTKTSNPSELLESQRFAKFIEHMRSVYDVVLIDSPPILAVTDASIIATRVDSCLLVTKVKSNNAPLVHRASSLLGQQGATIDGVVVNPDDGRFGYSAYNYFAKHEYGYLSSYQSHYRVDEPSTTTNSTRRFDDAESPLDSYQMEPPMVQSPPPVNGHDSLTVARK